MTIYVLLKQRLDHNESGGGFTLMIGNVVSILLSIAVGTLHVHHQVAVVVHDRPIIPQVCALVHPMALLEKQMFAVLANEHVPFPSGPSPLAGLG